MINLTRIIRVFAGRNNSDFDKSKTKSTHFLVKLAAAVITFELSERAITAYSPVSGSNFNKNIPNPISSLLSNLNFSFLTESVRCVSQDEEKNLDAHNRKGSVKRENTNDRIINDYENKIRLLSPPNKVFRYFATIVDEKDKRLTYMTLYDFVRSYMLNQRQNQDLGLDLYQRCDTTKFKQPYLKEDSIFYQFTPQTGLLSYHDYLFLLTVMSTNIHQIDVVFRVMDANGDGLLSESEFREAVATFMLKSPLGEKQGKFELEKFIHDLEHMNIIKYLFKKTKSTGERGGNKKFDSDEKLSITEFRQFFEQIQLELTQLEFSFCDPIDGKITEESFADLLISSSTSMSKKRTTIKKRVHDHSKGLPKDQRGVTLNDYLEVCRFLHHLNDINIALNYCASNGQNIDKDLFKHIACSVAQVNLRDHIVDVIFSIFDENADNKLSNEEFVLVMKERVQKGLKKSKSTGLEGFFNTLVACSKNLISSSMSD